MRTIIFLQKYLLETWNYSRILCTYWPLSQSKLNLTTSSQEGTTRKIREYTYSFAKEGKAEIFYPGSSVHFFNPNQEAFRDLSITVLQEYIKYREETENKLVSEAKDAETKDGITILDINAGAAPRAIRYALEVPGISNIIVNEKTLGSLPVLNKNIKHNQLEHILEPRCEAERSLLYRFIHEQKKFDVVELDTKSNPTEYFDAAVQSLKDSGLLIATFKDLITLYGDNIERCYSQFGATPLDCNFNKEMAIRIVLQAIDGHAYRYRWHITPLLSFHGNSCIKLYLLLHRGLGNIHQVPSNRGFVYRCTGCDTFYIQRLGVYTMINNKETTSLASGPPVSSMCKHCGCPHQVAGPVWLGNLHDKEFVSKVTNNILVDPSRFKDSRKLLESLTIIQEELEECPFYFVLEKMSEFLHMSSPKLINFRSALMHAGYRVSLFHGCLTSIKTNANSDVIWDVMRCWFKESPPHRRNLPEDSPANVLLNQEPRIVANFNFRADAELLHKQVKTQMPTKEVQKPVRRTKSIFSKLS